MARSADVCWIWIPKMKIRVGLLVGYNGRRYHGLQLNKALDTIEKAISECLFETGAISEANARDPSKIHFKSSSRTDKGVHAALNMVSVKIEAEVSEELVSALRTLLAQRDIHLYTIMRLTKSTVPSRQAESRIYGYVVPTFFLQRGDICSEAESLREEDMKREKEGIWRRYPQEVVDSVVGYRAPREDVDAFSAILQRYVGTKDFHNFTNLRNTKGTNRYIKHVSVSGTYVCDDVEYVRVSICGQSFLLHQIRKMVFFAVLLCKYSRDDVGPRFEMVFSKDVVHVPKSPAEYLFLDRPVFNKLRRNGGVTEDIGVDEEKREEYKRNVIYPQIHQRENLVGFFAGLDSVRFHKNDMLFLN